MIAELEADLVRSWTRAGKRLAQAKDRLRGQQPKPTAKQEAHVKKLHVTGEHINRGPTRLSSIGSSTAYRAIERAQRRRPAHPDSDSPVQSVSERADAAESYARRLS